MNEVVKVLIVLILVSVAFYAPIVVNGYDGGYGYGECECTPEQEPEPEDYRTGHEEHVEHEERIGRVPPPVAPISITPSPTLTTSIPSPSHIPLTPGHCPPSGGQAAAAGGAAAAAAAGAVLLNGLSNVGTSTISRGGKGGAGGTSGGPLPHGDPAMSGDDRIYSGDDARTILKNEGLLNDDGSLTPDFWEWYDRPWSDTTSTVKGVKAIAGYFNPDERNNPIGDISIIAGGDTSPISTPTQQPTTQQPTTQQPTTQQPTTQQPTTQQPTTQQPTTQQPTTQQPTTQQPTTQQPTTQQPTTQQPTTQQPTTQQPTTQQPTTQQPTTQQPTTQQPTTQQPTTQQPTTQQPTTQQPTTQQPTTQQPTTQQPTTQQPTTQQPTTQQPTTQQPTTQQPTTQQPTTQQPTTQQPTTQQPTTQQPTTQQPTTQQPTTQQPPLKPPCAETLGRISDGAERLKDATDRVERVVDKLPIGDDTKKQINDRIKGWGDKASTVKDSANKGLEYIECLDKNLQETDKMKISKESQEFLGWCSVTFKAIGELTEKFIDGCTKPFTSLFGDKADKVQDILHELVPVKEFGDELGKLPTSAARNVVRAQQRHQEGIDDILDDIFPRDWNKVTKWQK